MSATDVMDDGVPVALRDGSHVRIRQGRRSDRELLRRGFQHLSPDSRYRRFLVPMPRMMDLFRRLGPVRVVDREAGTVEIEVAIPAAGVAPELSELLRLAAEHDVAVPVTRRR
jgi:hypothetical protein